MDQHLNLVFQGGGIRGMAYAGVLSSMPDRCKISCVGGTSAGSIVAALLATGVKPKDLKSRLEKQELLTLLTQNDVERTVRLKEAWCDIRRLWIEKGGNLSAWNLWRFRRKHKTILEDLRDIWSNQGLHSSDNIRSWLDNELGGKTFEQVVVDDLKIVAADVSSQRYRVFDKEHDRGGLIAEAVHASLSIPLFFEPLGIGPRRLVDGGILSNFPSFLFAQTKYPTIGFRLKEIEVFSHRVNATWEYLKGLLLTMVEAHDTLRGEPPNFKSYPISMPSNISSIKFSLDQSDVEALYNAGSDVGRTVEWDKYSSSASIMSYYDPKPQEALQFSLQQTDKLLHKYSNEDLWVDRLEQDVTLTVYIEKDWTTRYHRDGVLTVKGAKQLFLERLYAQGVSGSPTFSNQSLVDTNVVCEEIPQHGKRNQLIRIPAFNQENVKGFLVFFVPPISDGQEPRKFHTELIVPEEFAKTLAKGATDKVAYSIQQLARDHHLKLKIRILVDVGLSGIFFQPEFGKELVTEHNPESDGSTNRSYYVHQCDVGEVSVNGQAIFEVTIGRQV